MILELIKKNFLHFHNDDPRWFAEVVALSLVLAALSWHFFESPLLQLKSRFSYAPKPRPVPAGNQPGETDRDAPARYDLPASQIGNA
jgi:peptidoglycan/LPS O-acetylase OafA/YrhL